MYVHCTISVQVENPETYSMTTTEKKQKQMFWDCISIKYGHLQISINPEPVQEYLLWLFLSSMFMLFLPPDRGVFRILSIISDEIFSGKGSVETLSDK